MTIRTITKAQYEIERAICDKASAYAEKVMCEGGEKRVRNFLTADEAKHPDYATCDSDMRGRVQQYELLTNTPEKFVAYIGKAKNNGIGCDRTLGRSYTVTTWPGQQIGNATRGATWRVNSYTGAYMSQWYARVNGREFTGRGFGEGMSVVLRETAESKRNRI